jgi:hypothetical protein
MSAEEAARHALEEHATILSKKSEKKSCFTVTVRRGKHGGLAAWAADADAGQDVRGGERTEHQRHQENREQYQFHQRQMQ